MAHGLFAVHFTDRYSATLKGGIGGGLAGITIGALGVYGATIRYPAFRQLTVPLRAFLITSSGTFAGMDTPQLYFQSLFQGLQRSYASKLWYGFVAALNLGATGGLC